MGLFDVIDEIAEQQIMKTDTGDNRIFGVMVGVVAKNYDKDMPGRVCVTIPVRDKDANELQWARVAMLSHGKNWGIISSRKSATRYCWPLNRAISRNLM